MGLWVDVGMRLGLWNTGVAKLKNDLAGLKNEVAKPSGAIGGLITSLKGVIGPAALAATAIGLVKKAFNLSDELSNQASQLDVSVGFLDKYGNALGESGVKSEEFSKGLGNMVDNLTKAREGGEAGRKLEKTFSDLGVTWEMLKRNNPEEIFKTILRHGKDVPDALSKFRDIFGKPGQKLLGGAGPELDDLAAKSAAITDEAAKRFDELGDKISRTFKKIVGGLANAIDNILPKNTVGPATDDALAGLTQNQITRYRYKKGLTTQNAPAPPTPEEERATKVRADFAEKTATMDEEAAEKRLTLEQQILELKKEEARLLAEGRTGDAVEAHKKLLALEQQQFGEAKGFNAFPNVVADAAAKIGDKSGGFLASPVLGIPEKHLRETQKANKILDQIERNTAKNGALKIK